jgi:3-hydroxyisobutyrate dehydrogenase-like beta-hydroxyacid dehydrogenase
MAVSTARCWSVDTYHPTPGVIEGVPASKDYNGGFACKLMLKDLKIALDSAK